MIGFPAEYKDTCECRLGGHGASRIIAEAFEQLGWKYSVTEEGIFRGKVSSSAFSWGETVTVQKLPGNLIQVESRCPWQIIDWGKNKTNVIMFISKLHFNETVYAGFGPGSADQEFEKDSSSRLEKLFTEDKK